MEFIENIERTGGPQQTQASDQARAASLPMIDERERREERRRSRYICGDG